MNDRIKTPLLYNRRERKTTWAGEDAPPDSPSTNGSIISSSINLAACALGASMLSLPYTMKISGPVISVEFLIMFGIMAFVAAQAIVRAGLHTHRSSYSAIVHHFFGFVPGVFVDVLLSTALLVAAISYIVGLSELLPVRSVLSNESEAKIRKLSLSICILSSLILTTVLFSGFISFYVCAV